MADYSVSIQPLDPIVFGDNGLGQGGPASALNVSPVPIHGAIGGFVLNQAGGPRSWPRAQLGPRHADILSPEDDAAADSAQLRGFCFRGVDGKRWYTRPQHFRLTAPHDAGQRYTVLSRAKTLADFDDSVRTSCAYPELVGGELADEYAGELLVSETLLRSVLTGESIGQTVGPDQVARPDEVLRRDHSRVGIVVDNDTGRAEEGLLFARALQRYATGTAHDDHISAGFHAWFRTPGDLPDYDGDAVGQLGGDRRRALIEFEADGDPLGDMRQAVHRQASKARGFLLYLLTPARYGGDVVQVHGQAPVAAAIGKTWRYSGWNNALGQPRPFMTLLPAGTVFFFEWPDGVDREDVIDRHWLSSCQTDLDDSAAADLAGFGRTLAGVWS